jgi:hypothetical protein
MANVERRNEFIRLINVGLSKDYIWSDFAYGWVEEDWPEQSAEVKAQVTSWVRQYADSLQYVRAHGNSTESVEHAKGYLRNIKGVLVDCRPLLRSDDIPY